MPDARRGTRSRNSRQKNARHVDAANSFSRILTPLGIAFPSSFPEHVSLFDSLAMSEILHKPLFIIQEIHIVKGKSTFTTVKASKIFRMGPRPTRTPQSDWSPAKFRSLGTFPDCRSELNLITNTTLLNRHAHKQLANHSLPIQHIYK
jgi:hypothetical protein